MRYCSTRNHDSQATLSEAIARGIAPDGGLYVPVQFPHFVPHDFRGPMTLQSVGERLLAPFAADDLLAPEIGAICREAFNFPVPLVHIDKTATPLAVLELFHGPTAAFKDFGARFLAAALERIRRGAKRKLTILVATSGDTGAAVASAFHRRPWVDVVVLYPKGLVSPRQAHQLACWGDNVRTFAVKGTFDDCQRLVKEAFLDPTLSKERDFSSANSINIGRLLPQMVYHALASLELWRDTGKRPNFVVPTGNLGNALACLWARHVGLPIGEVVLATNANQTITDFLHDGAWRPRPSIPTLANAMDVGDPSNMERLRDLHPDFEELQSQIGASSVDDIEIRATIRRDANELSRIWCPHSATAAKVYRRLVSRGARGQWVVVATAHPAKFNEVVEPQIGREVAMPETLAKLMALPRVETELDPTLGALRAQLQNA